MGGSRTMFRSNSYSYAAHQEAYPFRTVTHHRPKTNNWCYILMVFLTTIGLAAVLVTTMACIAQSTHRGLGLLELTSTNWDNLKNQPALSSAEIGIFITAG